MDLPKSDKCLCSAPDWDWVRYITALVLAAAALLKAWQFAYAPLGTDGPYSAFFSTIVVEFELVFSLALFFGVCPRIMRWATVCLFTVFAAVSFYKAITGEALLRLFWRG